MEHSELGDVVIAPPAWSRVEDRQAWVDLWRAALATVDGMLDELSERTSAGDARDAPTALDPPRLVRRWLTDVGIAPAIHGDWSAYEELLVRIGSECASQATSLDGYYGLTAAFKRHVIVALTREHAGSPERLAQALMAMGELTDRTLRRISEAYVTRSQHALAHETVLAEQRAKMLREQTTILEAALNSMRDGLWVCDDKGRHLMMNRAAQAMFGARRVGGPLVGSVDTLYEADGATRIAATDQPLARAIRGLTTDDVRAVARIPGREPIQLLMYGRPLYDASGRPFGGLSVIRDITTVERLSMHSAALEHENERVRAADRMKDQIVASVSHELRTPLNAIIGFAELLHEGHVGTLSPQQRELLGDISSSGRYLLHMIDDLLDLAKVEANKLSFKPTTCDLGALIEDACSIVRVAATAKRIQLVSTVSDAIGSVTLDSTRTKQVLYNYLSNAVKFTNDGGRVVVRAEPAGAHDFRIEVEDTGIGIASADQYRLFTPFQQLSPGAAERHGSGLGLALTKRIVEAQGGSVGVLSTPGKGSVFHAVLPRHTSSTDTGSLRAIPKHEEQNS